MTLNDRLSLHFMRRLVSTPEGRAHLLQQVADAEGGDEAAIFDRLRERVDDPKFARMIERHQADETRHEAMFRECAARAGAEVPPSPDSLKMLLRLSEATGHFLERPFVDGRGIMEAYLLLLVIEERAIHQFGLMREAFREVDPATAEVFAAVARDEERHLLYCHAISKRYAPDEAARQETLERFRRLEARAFAENGEANMKYVTARGWLAAGAVETLALRGLSALGRALGGRHPTPARPSSRSQVAAAA